jgi:hypothetical protein
MVGQLGDESPTIRERFSSGLIFIRGCVRTIRSIAGMVGMLMGAMMISPSFVLKIKESHSHSREE